MKTKYFFALMVFFVGLLVCTSCATAEYHAVVVIDENRCNTGSSGWGKSLGKVSFKTTQTWKVGNQEWSDVVTAINCQKETFVGMLSLENDTTHERTLLRRLGAGDSNIYFNADCRKNQGFGDLFSWCAVVLYQDQLCPKDWRVPTADDFWELYVALGGTMSRYPTKEEEAEAERATDVFKHTITLRATYPVEGNNRSLLDKYLNVWGGAYGGYFALGAIGAQNIIGLYWSQTMFDNNAGYYLNFNSGGVIMPQCRTSGKYQGNMLRCVRQ
jgi:uncharacterized protein (TIGR02145 family)